MHAPSSSGKTPSRKTLLIAWLILMALSVGTLFTGRVIGKTALGPLFVLSLFVITWLKSRFILRYYLNLRAASRGWQIGFALYIFILLALIFMIYLGGRLHG